MDGPSAYGRRGARVTVPCPRAGHLSALLPASPILGLSLEMGSHHHLPLSSVGWLCRLLCALCLGALCCAVSQPVLGRLAPHARRAPTSHFSCAVGGTHCSERKRGKSDVIETANKQIAILQLLSFKACVLTGTSWMELSWRRRRQDTLSRRLC